LGESISTFWIIVFNLDLLKRNQSVGSTLLVVLEENASKLREDTSNTFYWNLDKGKWFV
jgi:hypothetical protein